MSKTCHYCGADLTHYDADNDTIQPPATQQDETLLRECEWIEEDADSDTFKTSCGQYFTMIGGSIPDNDFHYCAFCGKRLRERGV